MNGAILLSVFLLSLLLVVAVHADDGSGWGTAIPRGCADKLKSCARAAPFCRSPKLKAALALNCKKTCGYCGGSAPPRPAVSAPRVPNRRRPSCVDQNNRCKYWNRNGFCRSRLYTPTVKRQTCGATCGLC
ncbi:hypothetical protein M3Y99_01519000 [Aphelenchoides fujianensis]|nr:hypothetical protein M3Y99_01519000 [Aphelenchoides fujianensis]